MCSLCLAAAVGTDGVVRFVDVVEGKVCCCIEPATQKQACVKMALDRRGNYAALITQEGEVGQQMGIASLPCLLAIIALDCSGSNLCKASSMFKHPLWHDAESIIIQHCKTCSHVVMQDLRNSGMLMLHDQCACTYLEQNNNT